MLGQISDMYQKVITSKSHEDAVQMKKSNAQFKNLLYIHC